ncbi:porin [Geoalkalibacter halelectricus]|uniref:Porin n=1 Tax=Geoalkalibacter halelectricus TaxID=2847045 RepID=A0ABY5ZNR6_9BACT|nr:porin [Geoalkalibacter halelectricus]MDO3377252.1 porin [Geoalkalibacter halelectricus]UWZ78891.1 porin [Geoalkalibacter halelectricus]
MSGKISGFILSALIVWFVFPQAALAAITLYDANETTFSVDGSFNTFYVFSSSDKNTEMEEIAGPDRDQSRVKMGFLPNWIGFNFSRQVGDLKLGGRSSFWVTINDSDNNLTETGIDVRQFYGTVDGDWGQVLFGKDFTLFNRSNIFLDEILLGYGNVSDTLGLIDGGGVSFGNIGTGYTYPFPSAQITYRTPQLHGFRLALGVIDPSRTTEQGQEKTPRFEGELTYNLAFDGGDITAWGGFLYNKSESLAVNGTDITTKGVSYGVRARYANFSLHASGFTAEGLGFLLGPGADTTLGFFLADAAGNEIDSDGFLLQGSYTYGPARLVLSYGENEFDGGVDVAKWENQTATGAVFYSVNDYFKLVAEYNVNEISIDRAREKTKTIALGAILNF